MLFKSDVAFVTMNLLHPHLNYFFEQEFGIPCQIFCHKSISLGVQLLCAFDSRAIYFVLFMAPLFSLAVQYRDALPSILNILLATLDFNKILPLIQEK